MHQLESHYHVLGLKPGASPAAVKQAYRTLAKQWHPDNFPPNTQQQRDAEAEIKKINAAYHALKAADFSEVSASKVASPPPNRAEAFYEQGVQQAQAGNYQDAIQSFTQAIRLQPDYIDAYRYRAHACSELGYENRAGSDFRHVLELERKAAKAKRATPPPPPSPPSPPPPTPQPEPAAPASSSVMGDWLCLQTLKGHTGFVRAVAFSRDGNLLVSGSADRTLRLWHVGTGRLLKTLSGHTDEIRCVAISHHGRWIASGSADNTIKLWDSATGKLIATFGGRAGHTKAVTAIAFSANDKVLISGSRDQSLRLWTVATAKPITVLKGHEGPVSAIAMGGDGKTFVSSGYDQHLRIREAETGKLIRSITSQSRHILSIALSRDGSCLAAGGLQDIELWHPVQRTQIATLRGHVHEVSALAFSPDGQTLVSGSFDDTLRLWNPATGDITAVLEGHRAPIYSVAYSLTQPMIASGSGDRTIKLWRKR